MSRSGRIIKTLFDRSVALIALAVLWPFILVVAAVIAIAMPDGSPFFVQTRIGRYGRPFNIVKFRTMFVSDEDRASKKVPASVSFIRRHKIDELPQLWNVLVGQMSFVGPRPDVPGYADALMGEDREVLELRPGITGPASLKYRNEEELLAAQENPLEYNDRVIFPDKVRINRYYLHHWSFAMDIRIIMATVLGNKIQYGSELI